MNNNKDRIKLAHGSGGGMMADLIQDVILRYLDAPELANLDDAAELVIPHNRIAFSTDTFVVKPIFFPGGDIGSLAVSGTVNDILMKGARPLFLSLGLVLEEGFLIHDLRTILQSIKQACDYAGVKVVTGDTKVVGKGDLDGICINTSGIGSILPGVDVSGSYAKTGDSVIVSGDIGAHGIAVMVKRNGLHLKGDIKSDAKPLTGEVLPLLERYADSIHVLRDPTRGGVAATLNEIADSSGVRIYLDESAIPVNDWVKSVCELLGFDPLYLPCEGRFLVFVDSSASVEVMSFMRDTCGCHDVSVIGTVDNESSGEVLLRTISGGVRILDMPVGELLPRIC